MAYRPPQKRNLALSLKPTLNKAKVIVKDEFPALAPVPEKTVVKMDFSILFKNVEKKKRRARKLKWGTVLLTKKGMVDSLTVEEREQEETWKNQEEQDKRLWNIAIRLEKQQNLRREFDPHYESPEEWIESSSEDVSEEEEEVLTDEFEEDEFEPEI